MAAEPRRTRLAAVLLRALVLGALIACIAMAPADAQFRIAVFAVAGLSLLLLLGGLGWFAPPRPGWAPGGRTRRLAAWRPASSRMPRRDGAAQVSQADGDSVADLADALVAEPAERQRHGRGAARPRAAPCRGRHGSAQRDRRHRHHGGTGTRSADACAILPHTRMPLFDGDLDRVHGIVHMRLVANELAARTAVARAAARDRRRDARRSSRPRARRSTSSCCVSGACGAASPSSWTSTATCRGW